MAMRDSRCHTPRRARSASSLCAGFATSRRRQPGIFRPIGSNGFNVRGGRRSEFDQQPIEAHATLSACLEAYRATKDSAWSVEAQRAFEWFLGRNDLGLPLYDSATGGCRDGLHHDRTNEKQGAESSLAFYLAHAEMTLAQNLMEAQTPIVT